jgi:phosphoglycolate phosphatase
VYPIRRERFEASYDVTADSYRKEAAYLPALLNRITGERREILPLARACISRDSKLVRAKPLKKDTKVFTSWDTEKYFTGGAGDYLVANADDYDDCYIVRQDIFADSYTAVRPDM